MNSQDFRSLQEAYSQVYELDEVLDTPQKTQSYAAKNAASAVGAFIRGDAKTLSKRFEGSKRGMKKIEKRNEQKEQTDLYDIILSHLLDEGYAETQEAAEAIMVNMGEEWRESIFEAMKPLPVGKMAKQAERKAFYHNLDYEPWSYYTNTNRQLRTMSEVGGKKVKKAAEKGRELANDVDNRLYRKYAPPDRHR